MLLREHAEEVVLREPAAAVLLRHGVAPLGAHAEQVDQLEVVVEVAVDVARVGQAVGRHREALRYGALLLLLVQLHDVREAVAAAVVLEEEEDVLRPAAVLRRELLDAVRGKVRVRVRARVEV